MTFMYINGHKDGDKEKKHKYIQKRYQLHNKTQGLLAQWQSTIIIWTFCSSAFKTEIFENKDKMVPWQKLTKKDKAALLKCLSVQMDFEDLNENQLGAMCKI